MDKVELETIEFVNIGDIDFETKKKPINAYNLNQIQINTNNALSEIQDKFPIVLYENENGIIGNFELLDNVENYRYVEIFFGYSTWDTPTTSTKIPVGIGVITKAYLTLGYGFGNDSMSLITATATLSNKSVSFEKARSSKRDLLGNTVSGATNENFIKVYKVLAYK